MLIITKLVSFLPFQSVLCLDSAFLYPSSTLIFFPAYCCPYHVCDIVFAIHIDIISANILHIFCRSGSAFTFDLLFDIKGFSLGEAGEDGGFYMDGREGVGSF